MDLTPSRSQCTWLRHEVQARDAFPRAAGVLFLIDIAMGCSTGFVAVYNLKRLVVMKPRLIASFYILRGTFISDTLSALPVIIEVTKLAIALLNLQTHTGWNLKWMQIAPKGVCIITFVRATGLQTWVVSCETVMSFAICSVFCIFGQELVAKCRL